ncbi:MAG TPA: NAD+ synthase [Burkholderiales bacterium]|nr:NAD+ synthase [Burkholderiales bacterium]
MKIAIAQINVTVGDLAGNAAKVLDSARQAKAGGASLVLAPELALSGYPPEDLLLRDGFYQACNKVLQDLAGQVQGITLVVGHPQAVGDRRFNAASVIRDGKIIATYHKLKLPNYTVFDEERYFVSGSRPCVFELESVRFGVNICADIWEPHAAARAKDAGAQVLLVLNASPYHMNKQYTRHEVLQERVRETGMAIIYGNLVGGQDELVFDGASFAVNSEGELTHQFPPFQEGIYWVELEKHVPVRGQIAVAQSLEAMVYQALCLGVRDYVTKNGFPGALVGLSGGIDSALTLAIAVDALGADKVRAVMMPSPYTASMSVEDARALAKALGVRYSEIIIKSMFDAFLQALSSEFAGLPADTAEENLQARIRGTLLMALSNKTGGLVLTTGNKSEMGVGYATLYGDMAGGFAVLKDITKTLVYRLAHYRNSLARVIPERILTRAPSAELKPNQTDQDSLPVYDILDAIMEAYVEDDMNPEEIISRGFSADDVRRVVRLIKSSEYKRRQAPVGIRITPRGFGKDWRYPITSKYRDI